jgi:hypothetical protein
MTYIIGTKKNDNEELGSSSSWPWAPLALEHKKKHDDKDLFVIVALGPPTL